MEEIYQQLEKTIKHLMSLHQVFMNGDNFPEKEKKDYLSYLINLDVFLSAIREGSFAGELYRENGRQMMLADFVEYIFLGRMYLKLRKREDKEKFVKAILSFVNLLMLYETMTVSDELRNNFLHKLSEQIEEIASEADFKALRLFKGSVGLPAKTSDASKQLNDYFDTLLPKTAGGLWHELLVFIFMMRSDYGYIIPLLLSQRLIGLEDHIVPPDFLIIAKDKRMYGVEVGTKKEIQSGSFAIRADIPTATIDTINSRTSDRCPICQKWILFCPQVIEMYSDFDYKIENSEIRCLRDCKLFTKEQIAQGVCSYTKYSRARTKKQFTDHIYANNYHYHYQCVLESVDPEMKELIVAANDSTALKTHFPHYSGLEYLNKG